ncbi:MAG: glycosyltransferase family 2 protein [Saprospiraceae bacterium]|nr:glycosyltransferase family 2 protein [Saprospiraceae bacterium]
MSIYTIEDLPKPPKNKTGFPWTTADYTPFASELIGNLPKITIITPSFNQGQYIEETIRSIILQGYTNLEYIVIDGGSTDETVEILKKYDAFITFWVSERDEGQSDAINKGLTKATGEIFNWINSDDILAPNALRHLATVFQKNPTADAVCGYYFFMGDQVPSRKKQRLLIFDDLEKTLTLGSMSQPSLFWRTWVIRQLKAVNPHLNYTMDWEMWYRFWLTIDAPNVLLIEAVLAHFRWHNTSKTVSALTGFHGEQMNLLGLIIKKFPPNFLSYVEEIDKKVPPQYLVQNSTIYADAHQFWQFNRLNPTKYTAYALEYVANELWNRLDTPTFWRLLGQSFWLKPFGRGYRFYLLPLLILKRKLSS